MNCKTTFMQFAAVVKNCRMLLLAMLFSFLLLQTGHLQAQTLVTDSAVPVLDVCSDYQQFTVKIGRGSTACPNGKLKIELPTGFELESGSVKVGGVPATVSGQTTQEVTVDVNIPSGPASQEIEVTYNAKALCSAISSTITDPSVSYTLQGCTGVIVPKSSETINIRYAVLRIDVTPNPIIGNINDVVERTISIRNQGNGELPVFTFERILGGGLSQVSYDYSSLTSLGWVVTVSGNQLIFSGANANLKFKSGETLSFKEKVQIVSCALTPTNYEVFYGCSTKCTDAAVNSTATHIINLNTPNAPQLSITAAQPVINCFNGLGQNTWTVTNTGSAATGVIEFEIGTQDLLGYISTSGITVNGNPAVFTVTPGTNPKTVKIQLPAIAGGANAVVSFFQYYGAPTGTPASCLSAPEQFGTGQNYFNASYTYTGACAPITTGRVVSSEVSYSYGGMHIGEVDIVAGQAYTADYLFMNTVIPSTQLKIGDKFVITVELAADLNTAGFSFNGVTAVNIAGTKKYTVTFTYGSAPWVSGSLNLSFLRMQFPLSFSCPANLDNLWYRVGGEIIKVNNGVDCTSVVFRCNQTDLKGYCDGGPCPDGMQNGPAGIKRLTVGHAVSVSGVPAVGTPSVAGDFRTFYKGDILEVYQDATIVNTTANSFNTVRFVVEKDPSVNAVLVTGSGKVVRNGVNITSNATVTETATSYVMQFVLPAGSFLNNDNIRMSIQIKAGNSGTGLKQFPAKSYLVDGTGEGILCGRTYTATGFYVTTNYSFRGASANFVNCSNNTNTVIFTAGILGFNNQDAIFQQEYRRIFAPTNAVFQVPAYITLTNIRVTVANQPWMGSNNFVDVPVTNVTNGNYTLNLTQALTDITEKTLGVGNGIAYLDEGFELRLTPTVSVSACEPVNTGAVQNVQVVMNGNIVDGAGLTTPYSNSQNLTYNTGIGSLTLQTSNNSLLGTLSPDGTQVSWVVRVGASGTRDFNSVWFAKKTGVLAISSVELVSGYGAVSGSTVMPVGNIYQLGDFSANSAKFYLIKASVVGCTVNSLTLTSGYNCVSNAYPATINTSVCTLPDKVLTHKTIANVLQTELFDQFNGNSTVKPDLCGRIWYTVRLHNGGDTQLGNLKIKIPLNTAPGLVFDDSFEYSAVFNANGGTASGFTTINGSNTAINGSNELEITLPNTVLLNSAQRVSVRIYFRVNSCDFKSGSKHTATPSATNSCGTAVTNITPATTRRLIIAGGSDSFPELREVGTSSVVLDPVLTTGGVLRSVYNAEIVNSGQFNVNDVVTSDYNVALKLPAGWSIVGNPATYLLPAGKVDYIGLDPNRGYVYKIKTGQTIAVSQSLKFENVPLKYTLNNQTALQCDHNFGDITISVYQNIAVAACTPIPNCSNTGIDQVLFENTTIMELPVDSALAIVPANQSPVICNPTVSGGVPTVADIPFAATTNVFHIDWYENLQEATSDLPANRIPLNTPLVNGRTYYAVNRFIVDGTCKSNIGTITVTLKTNSLSGSVTTICSVNNQTYQVQVTLTGTAPFTVDPGSTGYPGTFSGNVWTSAAIPATTPILGSGTPYNVTFTDANNCTPLNVTGAAPICCTLVIANCPTAVINFACNGSNSTSNYPPLQAHYPTIVSSCGPTTTTYVDSAIGTCAGPATGRYREFTRTFTVKDAMGNTATCTRTVRITDNVAPVFNGALPQDLTVSCASAIPAAAALTATDNCGTAVVTFGQSTITGTCANKLTITRTWTATDSCGNAVTHTQVITVNDNIAPVFVGTLPANITVSCDNVPVAATLTATDNCGTPTVVMNQTRTDGSCPNSYTLTRVWTATDVCGNTISHTQVITVTDTVKPTFNGILPADITISCSAALPTVPTVTATDNCGSATVVFNETTVAGNCTSSYVRTRTWTATDACGNTASHVQKITVADTEKPVFTGTLPANVTVSCPSEIPVTAVLAATDNCTAAGSISITVSDVVSDVSPSCANNYKVTRTYTATDACGNFTTHVQLITVEDKTKPVFVGTLPVNATYSCSTEVPSAVTLTATDNCGTATVTFNETRVSGSCANAYVLTRTWTAADSCGNTTVHTQTITVDDKTKPVFTTAPGDQEVECDGAGNVSAFNAWLASYGGAVATDNCGTVALSYQIEDTNTTCGGSKTIIVNFIATDLCGNTSADQAEFKITDKVAPVVTTASNLSLVCGNDVNAQITNWLQNNGGATATDACGTITWSHNYNGLTGACANTGSALVTFTATDSCGNASTVQATVTVTDTVAPTFVGSLPAAAVTVSCASEIPAPAVLTATDNCGTATVTLVETTTAGTCANNFTLTRVWTATDVCGNTTSHTQIITVNDQTAPAITTNAQSITVQCDGSGNTTALNAWLASHGGSVSTDNCGGVTWTNNYAAANFVASCGSAGSVEVIFTATDACGNASSTTAVFTIEDTAKPVFTGTLPANVTVSCPSEIPVTAVLAATDNCTAAGSISIT
ncbi:HYR-like domain-containing protein, partial [Paenimyroides baculatum]